MKRTDRVVQIALAAADEAMAQAGAVDVDPDRAGVLVRHGRRRSRDARGASDRPDREGRAARVAVPRADDDGELGSALRCRCEYGYRGPCETIATACAASTHAIGNAARLIATGRCDAMLTGGAEAPMTITALAGFANMTALSTTGVSRPFDAERDGFVMSEGAAVLVLEEWAAAEARGATILAEVLGSASNADAHHITAPSPGGAGAITCMRLALEDAGIDASDDRPDQRARHVDTAERRRRGRGDRGAVRHARSAGHVHQGRHRSRPRCGGRARGSRPRAVDAARTDPADRRHEGRRSRVAADRPRARRTPSVEPRSEPVEQLRLRRPQRLRWSSAPPELLLR